MDCGSLLPGRTYMRSGAVRRKLGDIGKTTFGKLRQAPGFPAAYKLPSGTKIWDAEDIDAYVESCRDSQK